MKPLQEAYLAYCFLWFPATIHLEHVNSLGFHFTPKFLQNPPRIHSRLFAKMIPLRRRSWREITRLHDASGRNAPNPVIYYSWRVNPRQKYFITLHLFSRHYGHYKLITSGNASRRRKLKMESDRVIANIFAAVTWIKDWGGARRATSCRPCLGSAPEGREIYERSVRRQFAWLITRRRTTNCCGEFLAVIKLANARQ